MTDIILAFMGGINVFAVILLFPYVKKALDDYERQCAQDLDPVFDAGTALEGLDLSGISAWGPGERPEQSDA